MNFIKSDINKA